MSKSIQEQLNDALSKTVESLTSKNMSLEFDLLILEDSIKKLKEENKKLKIINEFLLSELIKK